MKIGESKQSGNEEIKSKIDKQKSFKSSFSVHESMRNKFLDVNGFVQIGCGLWRIFTFGKAKSPDFRDIYKSYINPFTQILTIC